MKHTISVLVENRPGVLARISGLFSARGFNIDSLTVGETEDPAISRMTIVVEADERLLEQVMKQLRKLIDSIKVQDLTQKPFYDRELILLKVAITESGKKKLLDIINKSSAKVIDSGSDCLMIEVVGEQDKVNQLIESLKEFGIKEMVRTGKIAMSK